MKFLLIEQGINGAGDIVTIFDSVEQRDKATVRAIFGDSGPATQADGDACLMVLRCTGKFLPNNFPALFWVNAANVSAVSETAAKAPPAPLIDKTYMNDIAKAIHDKLPDNFGFLILAFPFGATTGRDRLYYTSNALRADAIKTVKAWLFNNSAAENWMKHVK